MQKYVEITRKDQAFDKENAWFNVCRNEQIPFVTIKTRSKLATVEWDYITYPTSMDEVLFSLHEDIKTRVSAIYQNHMTSGTWLGVGPGVISFGNLDLVAARDVAQSLFDVISDAMHLAMSKAR